jgi:hypothetical protein
LEGDAMQTISFLYANDIVFTATLDGTQYEIRMLWNDIGGFWTMSLRTAENVSILEGIKAVPDFPLLNPYHAPGVPPGELMVTTLDKTIQTVDRKDFTGSKAVLVYVTEDEINAI